MALYNDKMYFGNRNYMQWIPAPQINFDGSKRGYTSVSTYLNGGAFVRRSTTASKGYNFSWTMKTRDDIRAINDYADGVYGNGPIYFLDPFAMDRNLLPQYWAVPMLASVDAPLLAGQYDEDRPLLTATDTNTLGYPPQTATYTLTDGIKFNTVWIPVPPGYSLFVGAHGSATGTAGVLATPTTGPTSVGSGINVPLHAVTDDQRVYTEIDGDAYTGAIISLKGVGTVSLTGVMAQVLQHPVVPTAGGFISGQGHSGCSFTGEPNLSNYSVGLNRAGMTVDLIETEGWR